MDENKYIDGLRKDYTEQEYKGQLLGEFNPIENQNQFDNTVDSAILKKSIQIAKELDKEIVNEIAEQTHHSDSMIATSMLRMAWHTHKDQNTQEAFNSRGLPPGWPKDIRISEEELDKIWEQAIKQVEEENNKPKPMVGKYLVQSDDWFLCPDGKYYRAVWGEIQVLESEKMLGIKTNIRATNWYVKVGNEKCHVIIAGCKIHHCVKCEKEVLNTSIYAQDYMVHELQVKEYTRPNAIYVIDDIPGECQHEYSDGTGTGYHVCKKCGDQY